MPLKRIPIPNRVELEDEGRTLVLGWPDGHEDRVPAFELRALCPCARCVDEITGDRIIRPADVNPAVRAVEVGRVGRYALQITWSDGHSTGIYPYERFLGGDFRLPPEGPPAERS